jgi:hypothetical protein
MEITIDKMLDTQVGGCELPEPRTKRSKELVIGYALVIPPLDLEAGVGRFLGLHDQLV